MRFIALAPLVFALAAPALAQQQAPTPKADPPAVHGPVAEPETPRTGELCTSAKPGEEGKVVPCPKPAPKPKPADYGKPGIYPASPA